jgi:replicative DNA helicase
VLAHFLGDGALRTTMTERKDEAMRRGRAVDIDAIDLLRRHGLWDVEDGDLHVPPAVFRLPRDQLAAFLDRLLLDNRGRRPCHLAHAAFATRSPRLASDVQHLLLRLGVVTSQHSELLSCAGEPVEAVVLSLAGPAEPADLELELSSVAAAAKGARHGAGRGPAGGPGRGPAGGPGGGSGGRAGRGPRTGLGAATGTGAAIGRSDVLWDEIVEIAYQGEEQVYDLTVPGFHNCVAADIVVHNTAFALGLATHVAVDQALPVLFFSLEMGHKELTQRILASEARVDSTKMRTGRLTEQDWSKIGKAIGRLEAPLYIDDNPNVTVMEIRAKARRLKARSGGLGLVVVDYLQLMSGRASAENRQVEVSEISRGLKILARELEVPIMALSQLSRNLEARADKRPMLSDLRESGSIEQDADVVMFIYRDEVYNVDTADRGVAEIIVAKHRNGPTGHRKLVWLPPYTRFDNAARGL